MQDILEAVNRYKLRGTSSFVPGHDLPRKIGAQFIGSLVSQGRLNFFCASLVARFTVSSDVLFVASRDAVQGISCDGFGIESLFSVSGFVAGEVSAMASSGSSVVVGCSAGLVKLSSRLKLHDSVVFDDYTNNILCIAVASDTSCIATGGTNAIVTVWAHDMHPLHYLTGHVDWVRFVKFTKPSYRKSWLFSAGDDGLIFQWDPASGVMLSRIDCTRARDIRAFDVSCEHELMAVACETPTIQLYRITSGTAVATHRSDVVQHCLVGEVADAHCSALTALCLSSDAQWVVSAGEDETLTVSSVKESRRMYICSQFVVRRHCMTFMNTFTALCLLASPPESSAIIVAACATDGTVVQWVVNPMTSRRSYTKKLQLNLGVLVGMDVLRGVTNR
ncbi:WD domain [Trypanosoma vivax]|uniref:Uncharacterized protein n=1 Tax=Trypanosoma vivax (strain Y486) TaxID=1055687 RepID=G0UCK6_TRYVY|nr:hypothetical protein TRVL_05410 [Trypanosoma vivax]KAH8607919.1 WD domain [Trypanosoma vivax]CCC53566.1 conserved hypothetical protein [Trypanosoma vivax Y486]